MCTPGAPGLNGYITLAGADLPRLSVTQRFTAGGSIPENNWGYMESQGNVYLLLN